MAKLLDILGLNIASHLTLVIDNDYEEDEALVIKDQTFDNRKTNLNKIPDERRWQFKRGYDSFWNGDPLRACGQDVTFIDSRNLWRKGWVQGLREQVESAGGTIKCQ